jgi:hypothetical protein
MARVDGLSATSTWDGETTKLHLGQISSRIPKSSDHGGKGLVFMNFDANITHVDILIGLVRKCPEFSSEDLLNDLKHCNS